MKNIIKFFETKFMNPLFFYFLFFSYFIINKTDFDYHRKKRLNNGNYLILSTQGIYLYNEDFNSKIDLVIFDTSLAESNSEIYSSDIAQFLTEDNGFIICLIKNETYILAKNGTFLSHKTEDFVIKELSYSIIPYGHDNNEYYYAIFSINENDKIP